MKAKTLIACGIIAGFFGAADASMNKENQYADATMNKEKYAEKIRSMIKVAKVPENEEPSSRLHELLSDMQNSSYSYFLAISKALFDRSELPKTSSSVENSNLVNTLNRLAKEVKESRRVLSYFEIWYLMHTALKLKDYQKNGVLIYCDKNSETEQLSGGNIIAEFFCLHLLFREAEVYESKGLMTTELWRSKVTNMGNQLNRLTNHLLPVPKITTVAPK